MPTTSARAPSPACSVTASKVRERIYAPHGVADRGFKPTALAREFDRVHDEGLPTRIREVFADQPRCGLSAGGWGRLVGAGTTRSHGARRAPFGLDLDGC
jgi:hypothetical protein